MTWMAVLKAIIRKRKDATEAYDKKIDLALCIADACIHVYDKIELNHSLASAIH